MTENISFKSGYPEVNGSYLGAIEGLENSNRTQSYATDLIEEFLDKV